MPNFATVDDHPPQDRAALATPPDAPVLLVPSRLHRAKGIDTMLHALRRVPEAVLWLAGAGPDRHALEALAAELGVAARVRFLGWRADKGALFRAADVVVFPSRYEPFGTVTLEAWAHGRPLVTTDATGPAGIVRPDRDALMVPREDPDALARAIRRVLDAPGVAEGLVAAGQARYQGAYTEAACAARYLELFDRLIADRAAGGTEG
jgi:glycosyltransferase involved in cell wall biosynthesis